MVWITCSDVLQDAAQVSSSVHPADCVFQKDTCVTATTTVETIRMKPTVHTVNVISLFHCHLASLSLACSSQPVVQCNKNILFLALILQCQLTATNFAYKLCHKTLEPTFERDRCKGGSTPKNK